MVDSSNFISGRWFRTTLGQDPVTPGPISSSALDVKAILGAEGVGGVGRGAGIADCRAGDGEMEAPPPTAYPPVLEQPTITHTSIYICLPLLPVGLGWVWLNGFFFGSCRGNIFITNKYTTEVFGKVFQIIGQVMTKW